MIKSRKKEFHLVLELVEMVFSELSKGELSIRDRERRG